MSRGRFFGEARELGFVASESKGRCFEKTQKKIRIKTHMTEEEGNRSQELDLLLQKAGLFTNFLVERLTNHSAGSKDQVQPKLLSGGTLKGYQLEGMQWLASLYENGLNGILADEMGLGKTVQTISFLCYLMERGLKGPFLVVAPLSTIANWQREFQRFAPTIKVLLYHGVKDERKSMGFSSFNVIVTSYEIVMNDLTRFHAFEWRYLVVDEGHRLKNLNCKLIKDLKSLKTSNRLLLTGTPLQNKLEELWSLLNFILPDVFTSLDNFQAWFDAEAIKESSNDELVLKLHDLLKPFLLRRLKSDVECTLPPKREVLVEAGMTSLQQSYYAAILNGTLRELVFEKHGVRIGSLMNKLMQLRKVCSHPFLFYHPEDGNIVQECGKMRVLLQLLKKLTDKGHRMLIFTQFSTVLDFIEDALGQNYGACRIDGSFSQAERESEIQRFNNDQIPVFLISTRAGGLGLNLTAADTVIFYDSDWVMYMFFRILKWIFRRKIARTELGKLSPSQYIA